MQFAGKDDLVAAGGTAVADRVNDGAGQGVEEVRHLLVVVDVILAHAVEQVNAGAADQGVLP